MRTITAIFDSSADAIRAIESIKAKGIEDGRISYLTPGDEADEANSAAGLGKAGGAALGGVLGMGAATFLIPGIGPIAGAGLMAGALAGAGLGLAAGKVIDDRSDVPKEDLYFYEEALRRGASVVLVSPRTDDEATQVRNMLEHAGGRSIDSIRREWLTGVRPSERDYARGRGLDFESDEGNYRSGFEAALHPQTRGRSYDQVAAYVESCYPEPCKTEVFRIGYDRGRQFLQGRGGGEVH